jgi:hypothetical protein
MYDGTLGVVGAIEALRALKRAVSALHKHKQGTAHRSRAAKAAAKQKHEHRRHPSHAPHPPHARAAQGYKPRRPLEVMMFTSEEPTRFGLSCSGSRAMARSMAADYLASKLDENGTDWLAVGGRPAGRCCCGGGSGAAAAAVGHSCTVEACVAPVPPRRRATNNHLPPRPPSSRPAQAARAAGFGAASYEALLEGAAVAPGAVDYFVELHIEQGERGCGAGGGAVPGEGSRGLLGRLEPRRALRSSGALGRQGRQRRGLCRSAPFPFQPRTWLPAAAAAAAG